MNAALADAIESQIPGFLWDRPGGRPNFGGACPWQGWGTWQGKPCYLRLRYNQASMTTYDDPAREIEAEAAVIWPYFPDGQIDANEYAGWLADRQITDFVKDLVAQLAPVSAENPSGRTLMAQQVEAVLARMGISLDEDKAPISEDGKPTVDKFGIDS